MESLKKQLTRIAANNMKLDNGMTPVEMLKEAADTLCDCIQRRIDNYYESYYPTIYIRTGTFRKSLKVDDLVDIKIGRNSISLSLNFNELAWHQSLSEMYNPKEGFWFTLTPHDSYVPLLMNYGWQSKKLEASMGVVPRFTRFEGIHFIENGIDDFNRKNKYGIKVKLDIPDSRNYLR